MTTGVGQALEQALAYWRAPALLAAARQRPLPDDVLEVVRIAAGDRATAEFAAAALGVHPQDLAEAAPFYLQQLLFAPGTSSYRVLGVNPDAPDARIKEHYRWLVRWLHPDRNADEWEALYADRVNRAWQNLRNPEKRAAYDASLAGGDPGSVATGPAAPAGNFAAGRVSGSHPRVAPVEAPMLSGRTTQRLPVIVLGSFGLLAGALLTLMWYAKNPRTEPPANAPVAMAAEPAVVAAPEPTPVAEPAVVVAPEPTPVAEPVAVAAAVVGPEGLPTIPQTPAAAAPAAPSAPAPVPEPMSTASMPPAPAPRPVGAPSGAKAPSPQPTLAAVAPSSRPRSAPEPVASKPVEAVRPEAPPTIRSDVVSQVPELAAASKPKPVSSPEPAPAPAPAPVQVPTPITEPEARAVLDRFTAAYAAGDLRALMRLFTRDATNNRGGRAEIAYDYQELFDDSESRELRVRPNGWLQGETSATLLARFEARVTREGSWRAARSEGEIRFDLVREDGVLRIRNIRHEER